MKLWRWYSNFQHRGAATSTPKNVGKIKDKYLWNNKNIRCRITLLMLISLKNFLIFTTWFLFSEFQHEIFNYLYKICIWIFNRYTKINVFKHKFVSFVTKPFPLCVVSENSMFLRVYTSAAEPPGLCSADNHKSWFFFYSALNLP